MEIYKNKFGKNFKCLLNNNFPELIIIFVGIAAYIALCKIYLTEDVVWQFWIARQILGGLHLYIDINELNPPLWFWSALPIQYLSEKLNVTASSIFVTIVIVLGVLSALTVGRLVNLTARWQRLALMLLVFWMAVIAPVIDTGQRELLAFIVALPYVALIAHRYEGGKVHFVFATIIGMFAAYGFALKHYFVLIPLALELWLAAKQRQSWRPWRPELFALSILAVIYAVAVVRFAPEFLTIIVPMVRHAYHGYGVPTWFLISQAWVVLWILMVGFLLVYKEERKYSNLPFFTGLFIMSSCFAFAYFAQGKSWHYHSAPVTGTLAIAVGLQLIIMRSRRILPYAAGIILIALPASTLLGGHQRWSVPSETARHYFKSVPKGEAIFIASSDPRWGWPEVEKHKLVWVSRFYTLWMVPAIAEAEISGHISNELKKLSLDILNDTATDIKCIPPELILIEKKSVSFLQPKSFNMKNFLFRNSDIRQFIEKNYEEIPSTEWVLAYRRRGEVDKMDNSKCRDLH